MDTEARIVKKEVWICSNCGAILKSVNGNPEQPIQMNRIPPKRKVHKGFVRGEWTNQMASQLKTMVKDNYSVTEMAQTFGKTKGAVTSKLYRMGIKAWNLPK